MMKKANLPLTETSQEMVSGWDLINGCEYKERKAAEGEYQKDKYTLENEHVPCVVLPGKGRNDKIVQVFLCLSFLSCHAIF